MKIAVIAAEVGPSAGGLYYSVRAMSVGAAGCPETEVSVFAMGDADQETRAHWMPVRPRTFPVSGPRSYSFAPKMLQAVLNFQPDIIHLHGLWMYSSRVAFKIAQDCKSKLILSPRGMMDPWAMRNSQWKKKLMFLLQERRVLDRVDCFHALNQSEADSIRQLGYRQRIKIIPNGTDLPDRDGIDLSSDKRKEKKIVFIGRIHPKKGIAELLVAWGRLREHSPDLLAGWKLVIAGWDDGGHLQGYRQQAEKAGLAASVEWPGKVYGAEKDALLRQAACFILPSFSEGLPMAVVEAMGYGIPVIMTEACNIPEAFAAGAAIRIEPEPESIGEGITRFVQMEESEVAAMKVKARDLAERHFTWAQQVKRMQEVYQSLVE